MSKTGLTVFDLDARSQMKRIYRAVNWNRQLDSYSQSFWEINNKQYWLDTEYTPSKDVKMYNSLPTKYQKAYKRVLAGLTLLDTEQANEGMPSVSRYIADLQKRAVLSFMGMMENIHAKSYSTIFTTIIDSEKEIDELFDWVEENEQLQFKAETIDYYYQNITDKKSLYMAMVASVFLESFLFYSGFFLPLWLSGGGLNGKSRMVASGEIIKKIVQDEAVHGVYVGMIAQELFQELTPQEQEQVKSEMYNLLDELMENEKVYTEYIYDEIGLTSEVKQFIKYNANKALQNLGYEAYYTGFDEINPIVENALRTESENNDQFSTKGKSYVKSKHRALTDEDFDFSKRKPLLEV